MKQAYEKERITFNNQEKKKSYSQLYLVQIRFLKWGPYSWSFCLNHCGFLPPPGYLWLQGQSVIMQAAEPYAVSVCIQ